MGEKYYVRITPQGAVSIIKTDGNADFHFFNEMIGSRLFEIVRFAPKTKQIMLVDEEGLLKEKPEFNAAASLISGQPLCGTVIIAREDILNGEHDIVGFTIEQVTAVRLALHVCLSGSGLFKLSDGGDNDDNS